MTPPKKEKTLSERWADHCAGPKDNLRAKLIDAVSEHEGWEESAVSMVDEAVMPVIRGHEAVKHAQIDGFIAQSENVQELADKVTVAYGVEQSQDMVERVARAIYGAEPEPEKPFSQWWDWKRHAKAAITAMRDAGYRKVQVKREVRLEFHADEE